MLDKPRILVAGASGYLGSHIVKYLLNTDYEFKALARSPDKLRALGLNEQQIINAQVTQPSSLMGCCQHIDVVISCIGITKQQDGMSYQEVDYQANLNLLNEAEQAGVKQFIYISAFNAPRYPQVRLLAAKERFAQRLLTSNQLQPCVIRPNGFFSDLQEFYHMADKGRVYLFGDGEMQLNPIHGADLAKFCVEAMASTQQQIDIGGPQVLSVKQIAEQAFAAQGKQVNICYIPDTVRRVALWMIKHLPEKWVGPPEFFLTMMGDNAVAPATGKRHLADYFQALTQHKR